MPKKQWTPAQLRAKLDEHAANNVPNARYVQALRQRREAGLTRQKTTAEIAAMFCTEHNAWKCSAH
jgi:hypothetical protein